ncbi:UvrD-helicase domain-containing protein, partial [Methanobrevibacter gottschalkii]|uniref:UvrD-helicase domain-containing protein n=1 Tax=Methanobrevibacter gottschalkii TaxID=190974 RepID=UPI0026EE0013
MVKLSPKQEKIVYYDGPNPLSVEAGPGAGKTRVIIERVKYLLNEKKVAPESMLVITFTRKAADELKDRLSKDDIAKSDIDLMQISTIHGFCSRILQESGAIGFDVIDDDLNEKNNMFISKHLKDLGFVDEFTVKPRDVRDIVRKYNEYTTFKVDTKCLTEYIKETRPISMEYLTFVKNYMEENDGKFPFNEIHDDKDLKKSYYNAKYLKIAESYPKYLQLLEDENLTDFSLMQVNTLKHLELNPKTQFTNVLIDEFQDTDPVQMKIFATLMENADSFMVVGDVEQSIYGFRGSIENYFKKLYDDHGDNVEKMDLSTNYRSTNEIIDFSEKYIHDQKIKHSSKSDADGDRNVSRDIYYMISDDNNSEAEQLVSLILNLKNTNKIDDYSEIG